MTLVVDASAVAAALLDGGGVGRWVEEQLREGELVAPHHLPVEVASILRRAARSGALSQELATLAHADFVEMPIRLFPYSVVGSRVWELRHNISTYDAWYVALAEELEVSLLTLDRRLAEAPGARCEFRTPPV